MLSIMIPMITYLLASGKPESYDPDIHPDFENWVNIDDIMRLFLFVTLIILGTASCVQILKAFKINYMYIFEIDPNHQMTYIQLYSAALLMSVILFFCALLQIIVFNFYWDFPNNTKIPTVLLTILFLLALMFNPTKMFYWVPRFEILKVMWEILIAPFGLVKFRHFFMADVITSAKLMLSDSCSMICFYSSGDFKSVDPVTCSW